ncbi:MAG: tRNA (adenosine(37)-N6)-threonylcarbamoyltransferase complex ATPase subunit type 1 TsaE [Flavobacteriaceae bacterium]|nr:tRNA (adenosine(37)-N6)-threonylcarbamoyltransferase complex ATPase subunit type 1 TsaE [Flavobacteriaceae bacterium]
MEITYTQNEIPGVAKKILSASDGKIFLLFGKMGVGKTTLIKEIVKQLGVKDVSGSPTFSIVNEYETEKDIVYHFDFYRIAKIDEAYDMGLEDYLFSGNYIFIEWPEKIIQLLPKDANNLYIIKNTDGSRTLRLTPVK